MLLCITAIRQSNCPFGVSIRQDSPSKHGIQDIAVDIIASPSVIKVSIKASDNSEK